MDNDQLYFYNRGFNDCLAKNLDSSLAKELTDEEILSLTGFKDNPYDIFIEYEKEDLIEFARAILKKAKA